MGIFYPNMYMYYILTNLWVCPIHSKYFTFSEYTRRNNIAIKTIDLVEYMDVLYP